MAGVLAVVLFGLGGLLLHLRSLDRVPALALASSMTRGETVEANDLRVTNVAADGPLARLAPGESGRVIGRTVVADLPAGTLLSERLLVDTDGIGPEDGVVGLALEAGQYPTFDLAPGDLVDVVPAGSADSLARAEVFTVQDLAGGERKLVTLRTSKADAASVASRNPETLRLVWVSS